LVIGLLTPLAMVAARDVVAARMSWHDVGLLQSLLARSDWVGNVAAGVMAVYFLPRLSAAHGTPRFAAELKRAALATILPSALALAAIGALHRPVFSLLYDETFRDDRRDGRPVFSPAPSRASPHGCRSMPLYAMRRTRSLAIGEFLSMPLFAALLAACRDADASKAVGALWLAAYLA